ncbi:MAG: WD40 repeat domain-containing protein [Bacteroidia bacterium]|nr:WD40 repeat domain-containing protein [Bacteroidia bacterium]
MNYHKNLANYFAGKPLYLDEPTRKKPNTRKLVEQPWQQTKGEMWDEVTNTLCDLWFIEAKVRAGMVFLLQDDFLRALIVLPEARKEKDIEEEYQLKIKKYVNDLIAYAKGDLPELEVIDSIRPMTKNEREINAINCELVPFKIKHYFDFVKFETHNFLRFGCIPYFCIQQAYNFSNEGPIWESAEKCSEQIWDGTILQKLSSWNNKISSSPPFIRSISGQCDGIKSVSISANGEIAISGNRSYNRKKKGYEDRNLKIWNLKNGSLIRDFDGGAEITCLATTPDGKIAVSSGKDGIIRVWDIEKLKLKYEFLGHQGRFNSMTSDIDITPDGRFAISCGSDSKVKVWDLINGQEKVSFEGNTWGIDMGCVAISANGKEAISSGDRIGIIIWDLENNKKIIELNDIQRITKLKMIPTGELAITSSYAGTIAVWDIKSRKLKSKFECGGNVKSLAITHDGKIAFIGIGSDREMSQIMAWDVESSSLLCKFYAHGSPILGLSITPDGQKILSSSGSDISVSEDGINFKPRDISIKLWNFKECIEYQRESISAPQQFDSIQSIILSDDGKECATLDNKMINLWEIESGILISTINTDLEFERLYSIDNWNKLISTSNKGIIKIWDTQKLSKIIELNNNNLGGTPYILTTPDNKIAISSQTLDSSIIIWDIKNYSIRHIFNEHKTLGTIFTISSDGKTLICGNLNECELFVWDIQSSIKIHTFSTSPVNHIVISPDGRSFVTSSCLEDYYIRIWDLQRLELRAELKAHNGYIKCLSYTPDGKYVLSGGNDATLRIWDIAECNLKAELVGNEEAVLYTSITADGKYAISGSIDRTIRLWDLITFSCIAVYVSKKNIYTMSTIIHNDTFMYGGEIGELGAIRIVNIKSDTPIITIQRLWKFGQKEGAGAWHKHYSAVCYWCNKRFIVSNNITIAIKEYLVKKNINHDKNDYFKINEKAWENPKLQSECPNCSKRLKFNPFIVDNKVKREILNNQIPNLLESSQKPKYELDIEKENKEKSIVERKCEEFKKGTLTNFEKECSELYFQAEKAFNEENWKVAYNLYLKLVQQGKFDINYMRYNMAICKLNGLFTNDPEIVNFINVLIKLLQDKGADDKAQLVANKLKERLDTIKQEELAKKKSEAPWWKKLF